MSEKATSKMLAHEQPFRQEPPAPADGFDVVRASNGQEALALISERYFPVLLTDWSKENGRTASHCPSRTQPPTGLQ
jgi:hypothetical protein